MDHKACSNRKSHGEKKAGIATATGTLYTQENAPESSHHQHDVPTDSITPSCASLVSTSRLPIRLIPIEVVCEMLGLKRSATLRMVAEGIIPQKIKFGASRRSAARWIEQEIVDYITSKANERKSVKPTPRSGRGGK